MKYFIPCLIIILTLFVSKNYTQDSTGNSLKEGMFALQFQVDYFDLNPFQGSTLSCKYHLGDNLAVRLGISNSTNIDFSNERNGSKRDNHTGFSLQLKAQLVHYLKTFNDVSLYIGYGPYYSHIFFRSSNSETLTDYSLGLNGVLGVEWFFKNNMSLSSEYGMRAYYRYYHDDGYHNNGMSVQKSIYIDSGEQFKFGLSVYL